MAVAEVEHVAMERILAARGIVCDRGELRGYASDASFLTLGVPSLVVFPKDEAACDARAPRRGLFAPNFVDARGEPADLTKASPDDELYVRVGAGRTSDETNRALRPLGWTVAVTPSSGYSTFGGH